MNLGVIVRKGPDLNLTLSSILFDKYGSPTGQIVYVCDNWLDGFAHAKQHHSHALFVDSGTLFTDWNQWLCLLNQYPHRGMIAHIIASKQDQMYLDQQCWFLDLKIFEADDLVPAVREFPEPVPSQQHIHDDYTPFYVTAGDNLIKQHTDRFGQGLIAKQLAAKSPVVNWNLAARDIKKYLYQANRDQVIAKVFADYKTMAEQQLWIFNNEPLVDFSASRICMPASGLCWILNAINPATTHVSLVDISNVQLEFAKYLWDHWDGKDYGQVAWQFVRNHDVRHFQLEDPKLDDKDKKKLLLENKFVDYVNTVFQNQLGTLSVDNFSTVWQACKNKVTIEMINDNLVTWLLNTTTKFDQVWRSNVLDYKWTLIHTTAQQCLDFKEKFNAT